jgi:hypothetical protein
LHNRDGSAEPLRALSKEDEMTQLLTPKVKTDLPPDELLCTLIGWLQAEDELYSRDALKARFYKYARDTHSLPAKTFNYTHTHRNYNTHAADRVDNALNRLTEAGAGMIRALENDNRWQPGQRVRVGGYNEDEYYPSSILGCSCVDYQKQHFLQGIEVVAFCPHLIICWYLEWAFNHLYMLSTLGK